MLHQKADNRRFWQRPVFAIGLLIFLSFLLNWPYLLGGFYADDYFFLNLSKYEPGSFSRLLGMWAITDYSGFDHIWWKDPDWAASFWRPAPSIVIEGFLRIFGHNALPLHLLSIVLHGCVAVSLYILIRKLTENNGLALLAAIFFVACEDLSFVIGWIATITDVICTQFVLLALIGQVTWLQDRRPSALLGSWVALIMALASKEGASITPVVIIAMMFLIPAGRETEATHHKPWQDRIRRLAKDRISWLPAVIILTIYFGFYAITGMGKMNNLLYINPISDPGNYISNAILHMPVMWLGTLTIFPPFLVSFFPTMVPYLIVAGLVVFVIWLQAMIPFIRRPLVLWSITFYAVALLPQLCTDASERGLYLVMVPGSFLLAVVTASIKPLARRLYRGRPSFPRWTRVTGWILLLGLLLPGTLISLTRPWALLPSFKRPSRELRSAIRIIERRQPVQTFILNSSGLTITLYFWDIINYHSGREHETWLLSAASGKFSLEKTSDSSFVIRTDRKGWLNNFFARVMRTDPILEQGHQYTTAIFVATLEELTRDKTDVLAVRFNFRRDLSEPGWLFLRWNGRVFEAIDLASLTIGETVKLADTSDLWKSMN